MSSRQLLEEEITSEFEILRGMSVGTDEYKMTVDGITKLLDRLAEMDKQDRERENKQREYDDKQREYADKQREYEDKREDKRREYEETQREYDDKQREYADKLKQAREDRYFRIFEAAMKVLGLAVPSILLVWGILKSLKFEIDGTVTTLVGRGLFNKLISRLI